MLSNLRTWIETLEEQHLLRRIRAKVDWNGEIAEIQRCVKESQGPALLFENIKDYENTWCRRLLCGGVSTLSRTALMLNLAPDTPRPEIMKVLRQRLKESVPPRIVDSGPVKENTIKGSEVDLFHVPVPKWHSEDGGRYINTWCGTVTMDPETGEHNIGLYRGMIIDKNKIGVLLVPAQHWGIHYGKHQRIGRPMPVAIVYGWDPSMVVTACLPLSGSEYNIMGALMREPVTLVKCETSGLMVPASAEIVVEGTISPDPATYQMEGPYGEETGYYSKARKRPVVQVSCITFRDDPIYCGGTNEPGETMNAALAAIIWNVLEQQGIPGVLDVAMGSFVVIKIHKTYQGQAKQIAAAIWGSRLAVTIMKIIVVVDDEREINIHDPMQVHSLIRMNVDPIRGVLVFPMELGAPTDPALSATAQNELEFGQALQSKLLIDATVDWVTHPQEDEWAGRRVSPDCNLPTSETAALVHHRWAEYGLSQSVPSRQSGSRRHPE